MHCNKNCLAILILMVLISLVRMEAIAQNTTNKFDSLANNFMKPPINAKPYVWWHWMGSNFSKSGITKDLEAMKKMGIGGATIFNLSSAVQESHVPTLNNPWPNQTYRSPAYWAAITHAVAEAKRLGLEIGIHNTVGYSTTGGPWITEERAMKKLVWTKQIIFQNQTGNIVISKPAPVIDSTGWGRRSLPLVASTWYKDIAYLAIALKDSNRYENCIDITKNFDANGKLIAALPAGDWIVYRMGYAPTMSTPHPVPDEIMTTSLEADKMSQAQSEFHWNTVLQPMKEQFGKEFGAAFKHMLIDSYEAGYQNWTDDFRTEFIKRKSYDPLPWLLTFSSAVSFNASNNPEKRVRNTPEATARFDWDFKDVMAQLYYEKGWLTAKSILQKNNLKLQFEAYGGPFNTVSGSALADIPMAEFWTARKVTLNPEIAGAARAAGRRIVGAESFTSAPTNSQYNEDPAFLKPSAIGAYSLGINRLILHHWVHQPFGDQYQPGMGMGWWGTHFSRHQTWAEPGKAFFSFMAKTQVMLQYGEQVSDYLCLDKSTDEQADVISVSDFLQQPIAVTNGKIVFASGRKYPFLVLPAGNKILPEVLLKIEALVKKGAIIVGNKPVASYSLQNYPACDEAVKAISNRIWNENYTKSKQQVFNTKAEAVAFLSIEPDWKIEQADSTHLIKCIHRTGNNGDVYYVANTHKQLQQISLSFKQSNLQPELWNPEHGTISNAPVWQEANGRTFVQINLKDFESVFVVFRKKTSTSIHPISYTITQGNAIANVQYNHAKQIVISANAAATFAIKYADNSTKMASFKKPETTLLQGAWKVYFIPKLDAAFNLVFNELIDFSKHASDKVKYFAGTAIYQKSISINPKAIKAKTILDLGALNDIATVKVNGKTVGVLWYPPYTIDISSALHTGENNLEIEVTNNWANRLIGDEQEPADFEWGSDRGDRGHAMKAYPDWFIKQQPRPSKGRKAFTIWYYHRANSKLQPAGLVGPVQLITQDVIKL
jgi:hypothetical protein